MKKTLRIAFVLPAFFRIPIGGYRVVFDYANGLAGLGHRVNIIFPRSLPARRSTPVDRLKAKLWPLKIRLLNRPLIPWYSFDRGVRLQLASAIEDAVIPDGDAVVATSHRTAEPVARLSSRKGRKFYLIQGVSGTAPKEVVEATWRLPLRKIVIARWLFDLGMEIGASDVRHIPNGIDFERFRITNPPALRAPSVVSLYHGSELKGVKYALEVLRLFHNRYPNLQVTMFGVSPKGTEVPSWIRYVENPMQDDLVKGLYNGHAIYLGASVREGWALPPAEAMACGCAFVGTDIGGFRDYATNEETALLSPPGDVQAQFKNLCRLVDEPALLRRIQDAGTLNIQKFTRERATLAMEEYLRS